MIFCVGCHQSLGCAEGRLSSPRPLAAYESMFGRRSTNCPAHLSHAIAARTDSEPNRQAGRQGYGKSQIPIAQEVN